MIIGLALLGCSDRNSSDAGIVDLNLLLLTHKTLQAQTSEIILRLTITQRVIHPAKKEPSLDTSFENLNSERTRKY